MFGSFLPSLRSSSNHSLLGSRSRHCYAIKSSTSPELVGGLGKRKPPRLFALRLIEKKQTLGELGLAASAYYRWQRRYRDEGEAGLVDRRPQPGTVWNRMKPEEENAILGAALREPDRSPREVACWLSDHAGLAVSESSV
jgi:hypothetical protein